MFLNRRVFGVCLLAFALAGCGETEAVAGAAAPKPDPSRKPAPPFALKDGDGRTVNLGDFKGKVVLLNFWATWCGPCKIEIPWFADFEQKYKDRGFAVVGVAMDDEGWEAVERAAKAADTTTSEWVRDVLLRAAKRAR